MAARVAPLPPQRKPTVTEVLPELVGARWRWMTLAALVFVAITFRLGIWQLDRLAQRHAESARREARLSETPLPLTASMVANGAPDLPIFQPVVVRGTYDGGQTLALTNVIWGQQLGVHLLTPITIEGSLTMVLVDRGWVPAPAVTAPDFSQYRVDGPAEVTGWVRPLSGASSVIPASGGSAPPATGADRLLPSLDVRVVQGKVSAPLLPFVVTQLPPEHAVVQEQQLPYQRMPETNLGDGVHVIAAAQWFVIAAIIVIGQVAFVRRQLMKDEGRKTKDE